MLKRSRTVAVIALSIGCSNNSPTLDASVDAEEAEVNGGDVSTSSGDAALGAVCDPLTQNCADPSDKCTYAKGDAGYGAVCVAPTDFQFTVGNDAPCNRVAAGDDNCVKGQICIPSGVASQFVCWSACAEDSDCATNEKCVAITTNEPFYGACEPTCTLFGTDCTNNTSCGGFYLDNDGNNTVVVCHGEGASGANATCATIWDCAANLTCLGGSCLPDCDASRACEAGACTPQPGLPNGGGTCQ